MKTVAFFIVCAIAGWSLYQNFELLDKYVALKDKYAVALSKECKVVTLSNIRKEQLAKQNCAVLSLPGFISTYGDCQVNGD